MVSGHLLMKCSRNTGVSVVVVINWPNKECPLCYLKRHKPGHRRTIKDIVPNLLAEEMDFCREKDQTTVIILAFNLGNWRMW